MDLPGWTAQRREVINEEVSYILALRRGKSCGAQAAFLQRAETLLSASLVEHMGQELIKGEQMANQPFDGQGFEVMLL